MILPCECGAKLRIDDSKVGEKGVRVRCPRCGNVLQAGKPAPARKETPAPQPISPGVSSPGAAPLVLVAHDSQMVRDMIMNVLADAGFEVQTAADGVEALKKASEHLPKAMVLDVGLPGIYGFELCERLKDDPRTGAIKIILLASVYDMTRYKRSPVSLYGADDYIEKHHIADFLPHKIQKLISPESVPPAGDVSGDAVAGVPRASVKAAEREFDTSFLGLESPLSEDAGPSKTAGGAKDALPAGTFSFPEAQTSPNLSNGRFPDAPALTPESFSLDESVFQQEEYKKSKVDAADPEAVEKARRFARIIVSDIALYNQEAVVEGIRNGTFYELLKTDIEEGRDLYENRVPAAIKSKKDFYQEAFDNFIAAQKNVR